MRIYQTIHKYAPHIPLFEKKYNITDGTDISFRELQRLVIEDGYASSYILLPALEGRTDEVFFTIWNYERLQNLWAKEYGINSKDLSVIKHAQIEWYKPDVFYNHSAFCDDDFLGKYQINENILKICWYGLIKKEPEVFKHYDVYLTLHKPFVAKWTGLGLRSYELQPSFDKRLEKYDSEDKPIDFLFYGQFFYGLFNKRYKLIRHLLEYSLKSAFNIKVHIQFENLKRPFFNVPFFRRFQRDMGHSRFVTTHTLSPIYGHKLHETIGKSKFVINSYGDYNNLFKSNMRVFESLNCGSLLISEGGNYPEGFKENMNYIPYKDSKDLIENIPSLIENYWTLKKHMNPYIAEVKRRYSKQKQWDQFKKIVQENT